MRFPVAVILTFMTIQSELRAHPPEDGMGDVLEEVVVEGRRQDLIGQVRSASEGVIGQEQLELRAISRPGDVMEAIPGLIMTQHSGSGKANQMFLRGFNLDHGTDFATFIDGMPVNMRTHGHGQGYTDINFLIPELIRTIDYVKGPYHAELGDFSSAGGAKIQTFKALPDNRISAGAGENGYLRGLAAASTDFSQGVVLGAIEATEYDGPWTDIDEDASKLNALFRYSGKGAALDWDVLFKFYDASWNSADQIPQRAVEDGLISRFGSIDTTVGGETRRASSSIELAWTSTYAENHVSAYVIDYELQLWSNFTYLLDDPDNGDQFEQLDDRTIYGGEWRADWISGASNGHLHHHSGVQLRYDDISAVGLINTHERQRLSTTRLDSVDELSIGAWYELEWLLTDRFSAVLGLRADYYDFEVDSNNPANSGDASDSLVSPKLNLIWTLAPDRELYFSAAGGFHSNDARGTVITVDPKTGLPADPVDPLVRSWGAETGLRWRWDQRLNSSLALWYLELDSELLYVGDAGATEASRPSQRYGLEFNNYFQLNEYWTLEADFSWTDSSFSDRASEGDHIPGAIDTVVSAAAVLELPSGFFGSLRLRYFAEYPLIEDDSVRSDGSTMLNLLAGWQLGDWRLQAEVFNLLDSSDHDVAYFYASRLPGELEEGVEDIHYHIFEPRQVRLQLSWVF
jgi:outer membrane receptor protein involved in Fe transport